MRRLSPNPNVYPSLFPALNVADVDVVEGAMGPGPRLGVWLQGCRKRCPGCINADFLAIRQRQILTSRQLLAKLEAAAHVVGVSLSGGEPALQAAALIPFLKAVHERGLSVVCYTGYELEDMTQPGSPIALREFLSQIDLLICGPYRRELPRGGALCQGANQRLHYLTNRIKPLDLEAQPAHSVVLVGRHFKWSGALPGGIYQQITGGLRAFGIKLRSQRTGS